MTLVLVPRDWLAPLTGPLAVRGLRAGLAGDATLSFGSARIGAAAWLALVDDEAAVVAALDAGADDAVVSTATPALIAARLARLARGATIVVGELAIDPLTRTAARAGRRLDLLPREYAVLAQLARRPDQTVARAALHEAVWGRAFDPGTNVIEVHVSRLRAQLDRGAAPMLVTERARGYRLVSQPAIARTAPAS